MKLRTARQIMSSNTAPIYEVQRAHNVLKKSHKQERQNKRSGRLVKSKHS